MECYIKKKPTKDVNGKDICNLCSYTENVKGDFYLTMFCEKHELEVKYIFDYKINN